VFDISERLFKQKEELNELGKLQKKFGKIQHPDLIQGYAPQYEANEVLFNEEEDQNIMQAGLNLN